MNSILDKIVAEKKREIENSSRIVPLAALKERAGGYNRLDFAGALKGKTVKLIAEVKKASPSKGLLCPDFQPVALAQTYAQNGAAAISVLTEAKYFQGSLKYLTAIRKAVSLPLLRKDFILDEYQIYESAAFSADAILLITAILSEEKLGGFIELGSKLGLACMVEVHNEQELMNALLAGAEIIGINNRDLNTFKVDTSVTRRLRLLVPEGVIVVSESGIGSREDMKKMRECKVNAVLVGEALVTAPDIPARIKELMS
ncbi:MAG: indole-3-glycerol phosphate synthase TrpC [Dehalococcoidales bacterium]|jgi:indole-3-glycerol phosphate synthase